MMCFVKFIRVNRKLKKTMSVSSLVINQCLISFTIENRDLRPVGIWNFVSPFLPMQGTSMFWLAVCTTVHAKRTVNFTIKWIRIEEPLVPLLNKATLLGLKNPSVNQLSIILYPSPSLFILAEAALALHLNNCAQLWVVFKKTQKRKSRTPAVPLISQTELI